MANKKMDVEGVNKKSAPEGVNKKSAIDEDDVEGHRLNTRSAPEGVNKRMDVEGHRLNTRSAPEGVNKRMDVEGVNKKSAIDEDDVEGHMIGTMNPVLARDLAKSKDRDIERSVSRNNLVNEAKRGTTTRKP